MSLVKFHHFGLAVKKFSEALKFYKYLGYNFTKPIYDPLQDVELILCTSNNQPSLELVKPSNEKSPISSYLKKNNEIIYHICYEIDNTFEINNLFSESRTICVSKPKPSILFDNRLVSFYYIKNVGLVELLQI